MTVDARAERLLRVVEVDASSCAKPIVRSSSRTPARSRARSSTPRRRRTVLGVEAHADARLASGVQNVGELFEGRADAGALPRRELDEHAQAFSGALGRAAHTSRRARATFLNSEPAIGPERGSCVQNHLSNAELLRARALRDARWSAPTPRLFTVARLMRYEACAALGILLPPNAACACLKAAGSRQPRAVGRSTCATSVSTAEPLRTVACAALEHPMTAASGRS